MRVAVAQFSAGMDKAANLERVTALAQQAAALGARLVVFPEAAMCDFGRPRDDLRPLAESLDGPFVDLLRRLAAHHDLTVVAGMFEAVAGHPEVHNTAVVIDPQMGLMGVYRKRHLFDAFGDRESNRFLPGRDEPALLTIEGFTVGLAICYDVRFPDFIGEMAVRGAELLLLPSAWVAGPLKEEHWSVLLRARALDSTMYVAAAGQTGARYAGRSLIVDPLGVIVAALGEAEGVTAADVSRERLTDARARLPVLAQPRAVAEPK